MKLPDGTEVAVPAHRELFSDGTHEVYVLVKLTTDAVVARSEYPRLATNIVEALWRACDTRYGICPDTSEAYICEIDASVIGAS